MNAESIKKASILVVSALLLASSGAFAGPQKATEQPAPKSTLSVHDEAEDGQVLSGKVLETMNAGGYTYLQLEAKGRKSWIAIPEAKVTVGSEMTVLPGNVMINFTSKSLNKTFGSIVFSPGPADQAKPGHGAAAASAATGSKSQVVKKDKAVQVEKATGQNAYTVGEIYQKRTQLNAKTVVVRGKVVKVSEGIMGRNWIHLQDGSGDQQKGTHNLVATSQEIAVVGDIVTVTGTFAKDKDFGAGYLYKAIIEDAKVKK